MEEIGSDQISKGMGVDKELRMLICSCCALGVDEGIQQALARERGLAGGGKARGALLIVATAAAKPTAHASEFVYDFK